MTQCIIPGCERNPDPSTVINVDPTKPMKVINMNETKNTDANIPESFKQFLATGSSVIETCRELLAENERLRLIQKNYEQVFKDHCIMSAENLRLYLEDYAAIHKVMDKNGLNDSEDLGAALDLAADGKKSDTPAEVNLIMADYQTLKDYKGYIDSIYEEYDIPKDVEELRKALDEWKSMKKACDDHCYDPDELDSKLEELIAYADACENHNIDSASDLDDYLDECADFEKYKKGFEALSEFVEKIKEAVGSHGEDIPSTDVEDYD